MRTKISILLFLLVSSLVGQTTEEEFLYANIGYKTQLESGLDDKEGYRWKPITVFNFSNATGNLVWKKVNASSFEFEGLYREQDDTLCAIVVIYKEDAGIKKKDGLFFCIPHQDSDTYILDKAKKYFEEEVKFEKSLLTQYCFGLSKLAMVLAQ